MATSTLGDARSIVRGYSRSGIGEGPGRPIANGEQYLSADPLFARDGGLLDASRPWLTLDVDSRDVRRVGDRLEAWSLFGHDGWSFVARLAPVGTFGRRTAYASRALGFPRERFATADDPGAWLGRPELFPLPGQAPENGGEGAVGPPAGVAEMAAAPEAARNLLANLLQALLGGPPVLVAAPAEEMVTGARIHGLVSFARAALPGPLKSRVRLRIYTRSPELFLERLAAHLLVIPDDLASSALAVRRDAVLLDPGGERLAGVAPDGPLRQYAAKVVTEALESPGSLLAFAARFGERIWRGDEPPGEAVLSHLKLAYGITERFARADGTVPNLLSQLRTAATRTAGGSFRWRELLAPADWERFPAEEVVDLVLADPRQLPEGLRELQEAGSAAAAERGLLTDEHVRAAWSSGEAPPIGRLLELAARRPGLVSERLLADLLDGVSNDRLCETGHGSTAVRLEARVRDVGHRLVSAGDAPGHDDLIDQLGTDEILGLVALGRVGPHGSSIASRIGIRFRIDPAETTEALLRAGAWSWWRAAAPGEVGDRRDVALCWLASRIWGGQPRVDPLLEDWYGVMEDLGDRLEPEEVRNLVGSDGGGWPWIPCFEEIQIRQVARRMPDLGLLAEWIERSVPDAGPERSRLEPIAVAAFLEGRGLRLELPPGALRWFGHRPPAERSVPTPSRAQIADLRSVAGGSVDRLYANLRTRGVLEIRRSGGLSRQPYARYPDIGTAAVREVMTPGRATWTANEWQSIRTEIDARSSRPELAWALLERVRSGLSQEERRDFDHQWTGSPAVREERETRRCAMDQRVTFFTESGPDEQILSRSFGDECTVVVWTPGERAGIFDQLAGDDVDRSVDRVWERVDEAGGILAIVGSGRRLTVQASRQASSGLSQVLRLSPVVGDETQSLDALSRGVSLTPGQHYVVPVTVRAQERLLALRDLLEGMGPDMRGMVMQTLRSPSLDTRLARLEDRLDAAGVPGAGTGRPVSPVRSWRAWLGRQGGWRSAKLRRMVLVPLIVMVLLVVIWAGVTFLRHDGGLDALFGGTEGPAPVAEDVP